MLVTLSLRASLYCPPMDLMQTQNLIPELALIENLSPHWRARFEKALEFLYDRLDQVPPPSWDEVAEHCAISPHHFHRMFVSVFHETPGQYLRRIRLQQAVRMLLYHESGNITGVALATGFSSSQALAKALRRELSSNAKAIRKIGCDPELKGLAELLQRLGQPDADSSAGNDSLEEKMVRRLNYEVISLPERIVEGAKLQTPSWEQLAEFGSRLQDSELVILTASKHLNNATLNDFEVVTGQWKSENSQRSCHSMVTLQAGNYLSCTANLDSEIAYFSIWKEFDRRLLELDLDVPVDSHMIEIIHDKNAMLDGVSTMTFQLLVVPVD